MKEEIKDRWVEALTSGKYRQGRKALKDETGGYCCLGVLCDLASQDGVGMWIDRYYHDDTGASSKDWLVTKVEQWAGMNSDNGQFNDHHGLTVSLANLNDSGKTFEQISQIIQDNWQDL